MNANPASVVKCPHCGKRNRVPPSSVGVPRCANCHNPLPWMVDASEARFDAELAASVPVVVDFWAPWCAPCKMIAPALEELAREHAGRLKVVRLNVDEAPATSAKYGVRGIPLLMLARDGNEVDRLVGAVPQKQIEAWLEPHMGLASGTA